MALSGKPQAIPSLTGIRGVAALWVVIFHVGAGIPGYSIAPWISRTSIGANGFRGVDLFFILSGYIMMHVHSGDFATIRGSAIWRFAAQRCLRIYPAHLFVLFCILAVVIICPDYVAWSKSWNASISTQAYTPLSFLQTATLTTRWLVPDYGMWNSVTWSLSAELIAYMTLPVLAAALARTNSRLSCLVVAFGALSVMLLVLLAVGSRDGGNPNRPGLARGVFGFMAGAALCRFVALAHVSERRARAAAVAAVVLMAVFVATPGLAILTPFSFAILIPALAYQTGVVNQLLSSRLAVYLGKISFAVYLVHVTPLMMLEWLLQTGRIADTPSNEGFGLAAYGILLIGMSAAVHRWIERPSQRLGRRLRIRARPPGLEARLETR